MLEINSSVPDVLGTDQDGREVRRSDYPGRKIALYFYPKDLTSGCTAQACNLRDNYQALLDKGYQVIGVSTDPAMSHKKFIAKNSLPFPLIADTDHKLVELFGVWGEKSMYGRKYMGTFRTTFIISSDGIITDVISPKQVKTKAHAEQIMALE